MVNTTPNKLCGEIRLFRTQSSLVGVIGFIRRFNWMQLIQDADAREYGDRLCRNCDGDVTELLNFHEQPEKQRDTTGQNTRRYFTVLSPLFASRWSTTQEVFVTSFTLIASRAEKNSLFTSYPL